MNETLEITRSIPMTVNGESERKSGEIEMSENIFDTLETAADLSYTKEAGNVFYYMIL